MLFFISISAFHFFVLSLCIYFTGVAAEKGKGYEYFLHLILLYLFISNILKEQRVLVQNEFHYLLRSKFAKQKFLEAHQATLLKNSRESLLKSVERVKLLSHRLGNFLTCRFCLST